MNCRNIYMDLFSTMRDKGEEKTNSTDSHLE